MVDNKHISKIVVAIIVIAVVLCLLAVGFSDKLTEDLGGNGVTMAYETKLFDTDEVIQVNILIDEDVWQEMLDNAASEIFVPCDVVINGERINNVGIRPKGNTSLSSIAMDPTTNRYSFKIEFDQYVDGQTCFGLDKLILNNNYADATNMKEALIYDMFQYLGATSSLYNFAAIYVNGEYWGVYLALEAVEDSFLLRNFGTQAGEMYKPDTLNMDRNDDEGDSSGEEREGDSDGDQADSEGDSADRENTDRGNSENGSGDARNAGQEEAAPAEGADSADTVQDAATIDDEIPVAPMNSQEAAEDAAAEADRADKTEDAEAKESAAEAADALESGNEAEDSNETADSADAGTAEGESDTSEWANRTSEDGESDTSEWANRTSEDGESDTSEWANRTGEDGESDTSEWANRTSDDGESDTSEWANWTDEDGESDTSEWANRTGEDGESDGESSGTAWSWDNEDGESDGGMGGFGSAGGGANLNYIDDDLDSYTQIWASEITKTTESDHRRVVTALKNISEGTDLETYMNIDNLARFMAVHVFSVNQDSLSANMAHNYYLYEYKGQLDMFPWDYNLALGGMSGMGGGAFGGNAASSLINDPIDSPFSGTRFFNKMLENDTYRELYHSYLRQLVDEYIFGGGFDEFYNRTRSQIDSLVETDPNAFFTYDEYNTAAEMLYKTVKLRGESIEGQLDGTIPSTESEQNKDSSALIDASEIDTSVMGSFGSGAGFSDNSDSDGGSGDGEAADNEEAEGESNGGSSGGEAARGEEAEAAAAADGERAAQAADGESAAEEATQAAESVASESTAEEAPAEDSENAETDDKAEAVATNEAVAKTAEVDATVDAESDDAAANGESDAAGTTENTEETGESGESEGNRSEEWDGEWGGDSDGDSDGDRASDWGGDWGMGRQSASVTKKNNLITYGIYLGIGILAILGVWLIARRRK